MTYDDRFRPDATALLSEEGAVATTCPSSPRPLPTQAGAWSFCTPARPATARALDPAWRVFLGVEPQQPTLPDDPWVDFLKR